MLPARRGLALCLALSLASCTSASNPPPADAALDAATDATMDAAADMIRDVAPDAGPDVPALPEAPRCALTAPTLASGHLHATQTQLRDSAERHVILRGVNFGGRSKFAPYVPFEFADEAEFARKLELLLSRLESWGVNVLRLPFTWEAVEPTQGTWDEAYLAHYRAMLDGAQLHHMRVLVDFHQDVYAQSLCGDGFPEWTLGSLPHGAAHHDCADWYTGYLQSNNVVSQAFDRLWRNDDGIADAMERMWREMARRFGPHPAVAGFEVLNEPSPGSIDSATFERETLPRFTVRMGTAIASLAPEALLFEGAPASGATGSDSTLVDPGLAGYVFAPHYYDPFVLFGGHYLDPSATARNLDDTFSLSDRWHRPAFLGEFGGAYSSPDVAHFLRDAYDALDAHLAHGTIWEVSLSADVWNAEQLTLLTPAGDERPYVNEVVRGFARALDGTLASQSWAATGAGLTVAVTGAGAGVSELFVPTRHVGNSPRIGLTQGAGCVQWDPTSQQLLVRASAPSWTVTVAAP